MESINPVQLKILSRLLFQPGARFKELNVEKLETDLFSYHLRALVQGELIQKDIKGYRLTGKGKMVATKIDTVSQTFEKPPKVSVIVIPHRRAGGVEKFLIQKRTKEPYFGYWGFMAGKVKFGETLAETAGRELYEEAGLRGTFNFCYEIHEMVYDKISGEQREDKFFQVMEATGLGGRVKAKTLEGENMFVSVREFREIKPKFHNEDDILSWFLDKDFKMKEEKYYIESF